MPPSSYKDAAPKRLIKTSVENAAKGGLICCGKVLKNSQAVSYSMTMNVM